MNAKFVKDLFVDAPDSTTKKFSLTRVASFIGLILLTTTVVISVLIMLRQQEIDHVLLVELIGFVLTTLGYKNKFGFSDGTTSITGGDSDNPDNSNNQPFQPPMPPPNPYQPPSPDPNPNPAPTPSSGPCPDSLPAPPRV